MGPVSVSTPSPALNPLQNRVDSNPVKDDKKVVEKLDITKPSGTSVARSQKTETRDYQQSDELVASNQNRDTAPTSQGGGKRGSILDISV